MFKHNGELHYMDVTHRTLWLLNQYGITYTEKEMLGIMLIKMDCTTKLQLNLTLYLTKKNLD